MAFRFIGTSGMCDPMPSYYVPAQEHIFLNLKKCQVQRLLRGCSTVVAARKRHLHRIQLRIDLFAEEQFPSFGDN
jgi:hypothetical protein